MTLSTFVTSLGVIGGTVANTDTATDTSYLFISTKISGDSYIFKLKLSDGSQYAHSFGNGGIIGIYGSYIYYTYMNDNQPKLGRLLFDYNYTSNSMTDDGSIDVRFNSISYDIPDMGSGASTGAEFIDTPVGVVSVSGYLFYIHSSGYISRFTVSSINTDVTVNDGEFGSTSNGFGSATGSETNSAGYSDLGGQLTNASPSCLASDGTTYVYIGCSTKILKMTTNGTYDSEIASGLSYAVSSMSVSGNYLYALLADNTILKIDLTNTTFTSTFISNGLITPQSIANSGDYLYISDNGVTSGSILRNTTKSTDTTLSNITVYGNSGQIDGFYITADAGTSSVGVSVTPTDSNVTSITINGTTVTADNSYYTDVFVSDGSNTITIGVTAEDDTYAEYSGTVYVTPFDNGGGDGGGGGNLSNDAGIGLFQVNYTGVSNNNVSNGQTVTTTSGITSVSVTAYPTNGNVQYVKINDVNVYSSDSYTGSVDVSPGTNMISISVLAEDGTPGSYSVTVYVPSNVTTLSTFTVNGGDNLNSGDTKNISSGTTSVTVIAYPTDVNVSSITIASSESEATTVSDYSVGVNVDVVNGSNIITVVVTAEDGTTTQTYTVNAYVYSNVVTLSVFTIEGVTMGTSDGGSITLAYGTTTADVSVTTTSSVAYITLTTANYTGGQYQTLHTYTVTGLTTGSNTVTVRIDAEDENANATYTAIINVQSETTTTITCFEENTKILCFNNETSSEEYVTIKDLRKGHLVKTVSSGYKAINMIGKRDIYHPSVQERIKNQLYKCSKEQYPELFEDLIITGCHSILVKEFASNEEKEKTIEINGNTYVTEKHYRLPACADERASVYEESGNYTIYHIALDNEDYYMNYGVYANGLLVETSSQRYLKELSGMELIE
jgi:hypothetical protein